MKTLSRRRGFSLIELLVVISIIGFLASLAAFAIFRVSASEQEKSTKRTLAKLHSIMSAQWKAEVDNAKEPGAADSFKTMAGGLINRATVLRAKVGLRSSFPQSFSEATANWGVPTNGSFAKAIGTVTAGTPEEQSAVCIFLAMGVNRRGQMSNLEDAAGNSGMKPLVLGGKSFNVFVDGWGTPIAFYRWSAAPNANQLDALTNELDLPPYAKPIGGTTGARTIDPLDPEGFLLTANDFNAATAAAAELKVGHKFNPPHNWTPYLVSAGPDKVFWTADDIRSYSVRE